MSDSTVANDEELKGEIKEVYDRIARQRREESSCCPGEANDETSGFQPSYKNLEGHVPEADLGLGCGIPLEEGELEAGMTVLDLGSGAGNDCFVARREVGSEGKVIGVDFSGEMLSRARKNATDLGYNNVEYRHGEIRDLPVTGESVDVVISNCVLNLVPDKAKAFREIKRVLKPGGYFSVSDVVLEESLPEVLRENVELHAGCLAGALLEDQYLSIVREAGFDEVTVVKERKLEVTEDMFEDFSPADGGSVSGHNLDPSGIRAKSITVRGVTP